MDKPIIEIKNLKKQYRMGKVGGTTMKADWESFWAKLRGKDDPNVMIGQERMIGQTFMALNGVNMTVNAGEAVGIIGVNGAGKSTLLKLISRITAPTVGEIILRGRIASMLEVGTGFNAELSGRENIYMNGTILGMKKEEIDKKIAKIIEFSECGDFIDTPVKRYSSGMYVKLAFSVAAHLDSDIMIMDEVLAVGDVKFQKKCLGKMSEAATTEGKTILYVSHNMSTIRQLCTRCIVLKEGKIIYDGDVEEAIRVYSDESFKFSLSQTFEQPLVYPDYQLVAIKGIDVLDTDSLIFTAQKKLKLKIKCDVLSD
ncbi:MAG: ABC transporter ATP-binding protein, partial [Oscillospiraceae bacterium]